MATSRDTPNPLRPYYVPPSIGLPPDAASNITSGRQSTSSSSQPSFGSTARNYLSDIDYGDYLSDTSPSMSEMAKRLMDQALWNYTSVVLAQPFEVAKTVLQVHLAKSHTDATINAGPSSGYSSETGRPNSYSSGKFEDYPSDEDEDSDADSPSYFTATTPRYEGQYRSPERRRRAPDRSDSSTPTPAATRNPHKIDLRKTDSIFEVLGQLWQKEGAFGVWKGTNATFVYNILLKTIESWTRSMLAALLNVPDPGLLGTLGSGIGGLDIVDSPNPMASLAVAVAAAGIAGVLLSPLDIVRTRLITTPGSSAPRNLIPSLRALGSLAVPNSILPITLIHSTLPTLFSATSPLLLRSWLRIDPVLTPAQYSMTSFLSSTTELFLRLPLETVLRRGQIEFLRENERAQDRIAHANFRSQGRRPAKADADTFKTVVDTGPYKGTLGTMWFIMREEGISAIGPVQAASAEIQGRADARSRRAMGRVKKGQGVYGLWRGWRVGFWGLVGVWGAAAFGGNAGGEF